MSAQSREEWNPAVTAGTTTKKATKYQVVKAAARRHGVPVWVLWGVYGVESSYGSNTAVSSAGAEGPFQFLPSTAQSVGLKNPNNFPEAADAAAKYLAELKKEHGSWDSALQAYSGGGYGAATVRGASATGPKNTLVDFNIPLLESVNPFNWFGGGKSPPEEEAERLSHPLGTIEKAADSTAAIGEFLSTATKFLFTPEGWLQIGEVVGGIALIAWGVHRLINVSTGVNPTHTVTKTATKAAEVAALIPK